MSAIVFVSNNELGKHRNLERQLRVYSVGVKATEGGRLYRVKTGYLASFTGILHNYRVCFGVHSVTKAALGRSLTNSTQHPQIY